MSAHKFCPGCNENVPTVAGPGAGGALEYRCGYCGLTLDRIGAPGVRPGRPATPVTPAIPDTAATQDTLVKETLAPLILVAEDSKLLRKMAADHMEKRFPKADLLVAGDGQEAVTVMTRALLAGPRRGVMILDLQMPKLNGLAAALALRGIEQALERRPIPAIFFSAVRANENLQSAMRDAHPAAYLHKVNDAESGQLMDRLEQVMSAIIRSTYAN